LDHPKYAHILPQKEKDESWFELRLPVICGSCSPAILLAWDWSSFYERRSVHHWLKELLYPELLGKCGQDLYGSAGSTQPVLQQSQLWDLRGVV